MTVTVYRLTKLRYQDQIFSGLGGLYAEGRWTARGKPIVYTSGSISLAVLEYTLNYRRRGWVPASVLGRAVIPDEVPIDVVTVADLPRNWSAPDPPSKLRDIGQRWLTSGNWFWGNPSDTSLIADWREQEGIDLHDQQSVQGTRKDV